MLMLGHHPRANNVQTLYILQLFPLRKTGKRDAYMMYKQDICINHI